VYKRPSLKKFWFAVYLPTFSEVSRYVHVQCRCFLFVCLKMHVNTDRIIQFKFQHWLSGLLNRTIDSRHKSFKSRIFNACKWSRWAKNLTAVHNFSLKINWLNQLITKLACLMQHRRKYKAKLVIKVRVLKLKCVNSTMSGSLFCGSFMIPATTLCIVMFAERQAQIVPVKPNLLPWKSYLFNKILKHEKCFNMVSAKVHFSTNFTKHLLSHSGH
jgi:hypothetical protein